MAQVIQFGDSNPVPEIDFGLPGGALWNAGSSRSTMQLIEGVQRAPDAKVAMPDQNLVAVSRGGVHGKTISATGQFVMADHESMNSLINLIESRRNDPALMKPTQLKNNNTSQTWTSVILDDFQAVGPRTAVAGGRVLQRYAIRFEVLRA